MYVVAQLKDKIAGLLTGIRDIEKVPDINGAIERASRVMSQKISIPEAGGRQSYLLYNGVFDNVAPETIFGGAIVDLRPQGVSRTSFDEVYRQQIKTFDMTKCRLPNGVEVTFEWRNGIPVMRVAQTRATPLAILDPMNATTGWTAGGHATGLALDSQVYYEQPAALRFNASTIGDSYLEKTLSNTVDLSSYAGIGMVFLAIYTPDAADLSSLTIRLGSNNANYIQVTVSEGFVGDFWADEYQLVGFDLSTATTVGTPDFTKIDYIRTTATVGAIINNIRFGKIFAALGSPYELLFKTAAIFLADGVTASTITDNNDQIILNDAAFTILEHEAAIAAYMNSGGSTSAQQVVALQGALNGARARNGQVIQLGLYDLYRAENPSETLVILGNFYE